METLVPPGEYTAMPLEAFRTHNSREMYLKYRIIGGLHHGRVVFGPPVLTKVEVYIRHYEGGECNGVIPKGTIDPTFVVSNPRTRGWEINRARFEMVEIPNEDCHRCNELDVTSALMGD